MGVIENLAESCTGLSKTLQGEAESGRRSAREMGNVISNSSSRALLPIKGCWQGALLPLGRKMLANHQQGLDMQQLVSIVGLQRVLSDPIAAQSFLPVDRSSLYGSYDFCVFDATLPSQRFAQAAALAQAGETIQKGGLAAVMILGKDPKLLFDEWLELMGVKNADRFNLTPERAGMFMQMAGAGGNQGSPQASQGQGRGNGQPNKTAA
jgi:hypothetical protein